MGRIRYVWVEGQKIQILLTAKYFEIIFTRKLYYSKMTRLLTEDESLEFMKTSIVGNITKDVLDKEKCEEMNLTDLMAN